MSITNGQNDQKIPKVSVNIVTWNSLRYLPECFKSIFAQTYRDFSVLVLDNASADKSVEFLQQNYPEAKIIRNSRNLGFAGAHNQGIRFSQGEYVLVTNPDIIMAPDCLEKLVRELDARPGAASAGGKLLKIKAEASDLPYVYGEKTNLIDSVGLAVSRSRQITDRGQGEMDDGQYGRTEEVFGISGALALYRRQALETVKIGDDYFDGSLFAYKEDADLAWRLRLAGWTSLYVPSAGAYHYRGVGPGKKSGLKDTIQKRRGRPQLIRYYSYKNHLALLAKNEFSVNFAKDFPFILWYELKKFLYILFLEPSTLRGLLDFLKELPKTRKKRKMIMAGAKIKPEEMRKWFV